MSEDCLRRGQLTFLSPSLAKLQTYKLYTHICIVLRNRMMIVVPISELVLLLSLIMTMMMIAFFWPFFDSSPDKGDNGRFVGVDNVGGDFVVMSAMRENNVERSLPLFDYAAMK